MGGNENVFKPSVRAQAILDMWETTDNNIVISAVAGSGKTTTLLMLLERCLHKTLFIAFNKSIQTEIQSKIESRGLRAGKAMTLHSIGLKTVKQAFPNAEIQNNKYWSMVHELKMERKLYRKLGSEATAKLGYDLIEINEVSRIILSDDLTEIMAAMDTMDKFCNSNLKILQDYWPVFLKMREDSYKSKKLLLDFTDMIYIPVKFGLHIPLDPYYIMIDECQDLNLTQHKLIDNLLAQGTVKKWIAVGDRNQAIYGFAGATSKSFNLFLEKPGNTVEMPLDICYRCPTKVIGEANKVFDVMIPFKEDTGIVEKEGDYLGIKPGSLVICRNTGPLIDLYFKLLAAEMPAYINGNEILTYLIKFLQPYKEMRVSQASMQMSYRKEELEEDTSDRGKYLHYIFSENMANFSLIVQALFKDSDRVAYVIEKLNSLFEAKEGAIQLCTIHKSKGLEADYVYILKEDLIPSKFAKSPEQLQQEKNLKYVARTRAKRELYYLNI